MKAERWRWAPNNKLDDNNKKKSLGAESQGGVRELSLSLPSCMSGMACQQSPGCPKAFEVPQLRGRLAPALFSLRWSLSWCE